MDEETSLAAENSRLRTRVSQLHQEVLSLRTHAMVLESAVEESSYVAREGLRERLQEEWKQQQRNIVEPIGQHLSLREATLLAATETCEAATQTIERGNPERFQQRSMGPTVDSTEMCEATSQTIEMVTINHVDIRQLQVILPQAQGGAEQREEHGPRSDEPMMTMLTPRPPDEMLSEVSSPRWNPLGCDLPSTLQVFSEELTTLREAAELVVTHGGSEEAANSIRLALSAMMEMQKVTCFD